MVMALLFEAGLGWPGWLYDRIRHPVVWIGALVSFLDAKLNRESAGDSSRKLFGVVTMLTVVGVTVAVSTAIALSIPDSLPGHIAEALIASSLLASRSLYKHVAAVISPLAAGDLAAARIAVGHIVGRDPANLDSPAIARASIESLAENASDGVVAPLFWGALFGLPGIAAYKAINTLDSMIGHRTPRYSSFGWASARTDDLANFLPARVTALAFSIAARSLTSFRIACRDAKLHRSPNAGWPESALAGALDIRLSGPRIYDGRPTDEPWVNGESADPDHNSIQDGLTLYVGAMILIWLAMLAIALVLW